MWPEGNKNQYRSNNTGNSRDSRDYDTTYAADGGKSMKKSKNRLTRRKTNYSKAANFNLTKYDSLVSKTSNLKNSDMKSPNNPKSQLFGSRSDMPPNNPNDKHDKEMPISGLKDNHLL